MHNDIAAVRAAHGVARHLILEVCGLSMRARGLVHVSHSIRVNASVFSQWGLDESCFRDSFPAFDIRLELGALFDRSRRGATFLVRFLQRGTL